MFDFHSDNTHTSLPRNKKPGNKTVSYFSPNPLSIFISFLSLPNKLIGYVTQSNGSYDCHKAVISLMKCALGSFPQQIIESASI